MHLCVIWSRPRCCMKKKKEEEKAREPAGSADTPAHLLLKAGWKSTSPENNTPQTYLLHQTERVAVFHIIAWAQTKMPLFALWFQKPRYLRLFVNINSDETEGKRWRWVRARGAAGRGRRRKGGKNQSNTAELSDHMKLWILGLSIQPLSAELCKSIQTDTKSKHTLNATIGNWSERSLPF